MALLSLSALVSFACFPALVQADSSEIQYQDAPPTATGKGPTQSNPTHANPPAKSSQQTGGGSTAPGNATHSDANSQASNQKSSTDSSSSPTGGSNGGNDGGTPQGSPDNGSNKAPAQGSQPNGQSGVALASPTAEDDGGSSPLVPIVIAFLILAAISIGVVLARQRRQRRGTGGASVSPEAN